MSVGRKAGFSVAAGLGLGLLAGVSFASPAAAQNYPERSVTFLCRTRLAAALTSILACWQTNCATS